jgi:hypothetical protein
MISPDIALARAWYERQRTLDRLTHQVGLRSWLAARADRVEAIVQAVAVRRLRPLAPLTPWSKNVAALELAANDYITVRRQFRGFENRTL